MKLFVISDCHFGQDSILGFKTESGRLLRPEFTSREEMDRGMVEAWNRVVRPEDHVYVVGDFSMKKWALLKYGPQLLGHKRLVGGNHDIFKTKEYLAAGFEEIKGIRVIDDMVMSHIPIHPLNMKERWLVNIHGHIHNNLSLTSFTPQYGKRYYNVSTEVLGYTPKLLSEIKKEVQEWNAT